jgi:lysophospholipase L1-like esterase
MHYQRYVALGDSQTEGVGDGDDVIGLRGWADRLAEQLATLNPELHYANLAVRGRRAAEVYADQLGPAVAMRPDLATVVAGMNDVIRPSYDAEQVAGHLEAMFAELTAVGAQVATVTYPDIGAIAPVARRLVPRVVDLNARIRDAAARHQVAVVDVWDVAVTTDHRLWSTDRLHASPLGHQRIAAAVADVLGLPDSDRTWAEPLPALPPRRRWQTAADEARWATTFLGPWIGRRLRGRSSGDGRTAKRPQLLPFHVAGDTRA